jgi:hypothetical protein
MFSYRFRPGTDHDDEEQRADHVQASAYQPDRPPGHAWVSINDTAPPSVRLGREVWRVASVLSRHFGVQRTVS